MSKTAGPLEPTAVASRRVMTPSGSKDGAILIEGGRIRQIVDLQDVPASIPIEDMGDRVIMPGLVDGHVHINEPGRAEWEGFHQGTRAAAAGGVTTLGDMPLNCRPVTSTLEALEAKRWSTSGQLHVDVGFHGGLLPGYQDQLEPLVEGGILAMKAFLVDPGIGDFSPVGETDLESAMPALARLGIPLLVHAELIAKDVSHDASEASYEGDARSYPAYRASRPSRYEMDAIEMLIRLCRKTGCHVHIVHLATAHALGTLRSARAEGLPITVETCPHYLTFAAEQIPDGDTRFKCAPPIRGEIHRDGLWTGLADGVIDLIASDHSPAPASLRRLGQGDFRRAWGGIPSLQLLLPATWTAALNRGFGVFDLCRWLARKPAELLGLEGRKGALVPGADADLVVWDPAATFQVVGRDLHHRHPETPYEGRTLFGVVERTYLRGQQVYDRREGFSEPRGQVVRRTTDGDETSEESSP